MPKKRKCRYTAEELEVHDLAVKLRKMTDQQLVDAFKDASQNSAHCRQEPPLASGGSDTTTDVCAVRQLLNELSEGKCKGIGTGTVNKITTYAMDRGMI